MPSAPSATDPSLTDEARHALYRRSLIVVVVSQVFGGAGLAAGVTVGALLAQDMLGNDSLAGLPTALFTLGSALTAFAVGRLTQRTGRRGGLAAGFAAGALGAVGIVTAAVADRPVLLFLSLFVYGAGTATNLQARYAGTDLAPPGRRATAVSIALVSTTAGAVGGPLSVDLLGEFAVSAGLPALTGPFVLAAVAFAVAGLVLFVFLRPDPYLVAQRLAGPPAVESTAPAGPDKGVVVGATVMVLTQVAMVAIMTMTPVHMRHHDRGLGQIGLVISLHIAAMFLPSLVTGRLVDRLGSRPVAVAAAVTLLAAGVVAAVAPGDSVAGLTIALMLLGLGWNFGLISGTTYIVESTTPETRARTQGSVDVLIALSGAGGGAASAVITDATSFATLSLAGGLLALLLIPVLVWQRRPSQDATPGAVPRP
ncbi:MFS transporter [Paractinoplanes hotanensis]|uniref:MFS transporter n=1 Tax=Paractinoplanes hotanensis TaxID=2906497 RepID=A0ABT0XTW6_9ACTN|nr:MFS transporter [Actinoplanes hotanensis]MCM4076579.1 MFS transporter [Actinoplanes hotanensis]